MTETTSVDLVIIGMGPGAETLATTAVEAGLSVVAVDKHLVGGECPYYGCVPSKMMIRAADLLAEAGRVSSSAGDVVITPSWAPVATRVAEEATDHWNDQVAVDRLEDAGITVHHGVGRLDGPGRVVVELPDGSVGPTYSAGCGVVLNTGTRPATPPIDGLTDTPFWTNRDIVAATSVPGSLIVVGGGPIGCEFAQVFARFGSRVTVVQHNDRLVPVAEPEASTVLEETFVAGGIRVLTGARPASVHYADGTFTLTLESGEEITGEKLLVAVGRTPNLDDVGLETVGLDPTARTVTVDERLRAGEKLWAIGDITGHGAFTHVATYQQAIAARDILGTEGPPAAYQAVPWVTFTDPEVAGVGMTEAQALAAGLTVRTGSTPLESSSRGWIHGPGGRGVIKVVEDADRGVLVGASAVGPSGGEVLGFLAVAVHACVPVATLRSMIYAYPTFHRAIETALNDLS